MHTPTCPRCGAPVRAPGLMSSQWSCERHGVVQPLRTWLPASPEVLAQASTQSVVPVWSLAPLLPGWTLTGLAMAGDERSGARASAVAFSGPSPIGGPADLVVVAEEPGVGLACRLMGVDALDPGVATDGAPDAKVVAAGHATPLWRCDSTPDRIAFGGEASGVWLWMVLWPPAAELLLIEHLELHDLRSQDHHGLDLPVGAATSRLG